MHTSRVWRFVKTSLTYSMTRSIVLQLVRMYGAKLAASSQVGSKLQRSFPAWGRGESGGALSSTPLHMHSATLRRRDTFMLQLHPGFCVAGLAWGHARPGGHGVTLWHFRPTIRCAAVVSRY